MERANRRWLSIALIGVLVPVSLLAVLKLTGVLWTSQPPETIPVDVVSGNLIRPSNLVTFARWVENNYSDGITSVNLKVAISTYHVGDSSYAPYDWLRLKTVAGANTTQGFLQSINVHFSRADNSSCVNILTSPSHLTVYNLRVEKVKDRPLKDEGHIMATALGKPGNCSLTSLIDWVFFDDGDMDHTVTVTLEAMLFNGTAYQKIFVPIQIGVLIS